MLMTSHLLFMEWLWADMTKSPSHVAYTVALFVLIIAAILTRKDLFEYSGANLFVSGTLLVVAGGAEAYGHLVHYGDPTWLLSSIGNFVFALGVLFVVMMMVVFQYMMTLGILNGLSYEGGFDNKYTQGYKSVVIGGIAIIICAFFSKELALAVAGAFLIYQLYVLGYAIYSAVREKGSVGYALFAIPVYLVSMAGILFLVLHFLMAAICVVVLYLFAKGSASRSTSSSHDTHSEHSSGFRECSNCLFGSGALHFHCSTSGRDVDADDYCDLWQHN